MSQSHSQSQDTYEEETFVIWLNSQGAFPFSSHCSWQLRKVWKVLRKLKEARHAYVCPPPPPPLPHPLHTKSLSIFYVLSEEKKQLICRFRWFQSLWRLQCGSLFVRCLNSHGHKLTLLSLKPWGPIFSCSWHTVGGTSHRAFARLLK